ncbi:hypothetical protein D9V86_11270, partial [Bacteroidetes/Chlorobi group bacterium ChocPot_Mid]
EISMATYRVDGQQGTSRGTSGFSVKVEADEKIINRYGSSNDKQKHFEAVVKANHFPLAEVVKVSYYCKI